jgi:hypothetical protein
MRQLGIHDKLVQTMIDKHIYLTFSYKTMLAYKKTPGYALATTEFER